MGKTGNRRRKLTVKDVEKATRDFDDDLPTELQPVPELNLDLAILPSVNTGKATHLITLTKDHMLEYPELFMDVHVVGPRWEEAAFAEMFARSHCKRAKSIEESDLVVFVGGSDVDPALYGEERHKETNIYPQRDSDDINEYVKALSLGIPMFGVCRGAQFLQVMNGGKLYQHVDNHYGDHSMIDVTTRTVINQVSSVHHQMVIANPKGGMQILATANKSRNRWRNPKDNDLGVMADIEAFYYPDTGCFGVQGHPEYRGYNFFAKWCLEKIQELFIDMKRPDGTDNPDARYEYRSGFLRMKEDSKTDHVVPVDAGVVATVNRGVK